MGCATSTDRQTMPVTTKRGVDSDNWMFYAPQHVDVDAVCLHCGQPKPGLDTISDSTDYADGQLYTPASSRCESDDSRLYTPQSEYSSAGPVDPSEYIFRPRTPSPRVGIGGEYTPHSTTASRRLCTPRLAFTHSNSGQQSPRLYTNTPVPNSKASLGPPSSTTCTSRSYSLLSTPTDHSPSSHARNNLTLDPTLFTNVLSPFAEATHGFNKIDTDCASRFSGPHGSLSDFTTPTSSHNIETTYPLTPLSVRTEPFPRLESHQVS